MLNAAGTAAQRDWVHPDLVTIGVAAGTLDITVNRLRKLIVRLGLEPHARSANGRHYRDPTALRRDLEKARRTQRTAGPDVLATLGSVDWHTARTRSRSRQVADHLRNAIDRGLLRSDPVLPSNEVIAHHYRVSGPTVTRAINTLVAEGLVVRDRRRRRVVQQPADHARGSAPNPATR